MSHDMCNSSHTTQWKLPILKLPVNSQGTSDFVEKFKFRKFLSIIHDSSDKGCKFHGKNSKIQICSPSNYKKSLSTASSIQEVSNHFWTVIRFLTQNVLWSLPIILKISWLVSEPSRKRLERVLGLQHTSTKKINLRLKATLHGNWLVFQLPLLKFITPEKGHRNLTKSSSCFFLLT